MPVAQFRPQRKCQPSLAAFAFAFVNIAAFFLCTTLNIAQAQNCYLPGSFSMDFGAVTSGGAAATSNITITCEPDYSGAQRTLYYQVCIYINPGDWSVGQPTRRMTNYNGAFLNYNLFSDPARTQLIGAPGTFPVYRVQISISPGSPKSTHVPIYGWVYPGQAVPSTHPFQEYNQEGLLRFRYDTAPFTHSQEDCSYGGLGGGETAFGSSGVLARFDDSCWIVTTNLDFGSVVPPQKPVLSTANIRVQCPPGTTWKVSLSQGANFDGVFRRMAGPGGFVKYQLYQDESKSQVWGDTEGNMVSGSTGAEGQAASLTVYGEAPRQPEVVVGNYSDTIIATLYF